MKLHHEVNIIVFLICFCNMTITMKANHLMSCYTTNLFNNHSGSQNHLEKHSLKNLKPTIRYKSLQRFIAAHYWTCPMITFSNVQPLTEVSIPSYSCLLENNKNIISISCQMKSKVTSSHLVVLNKCCPQNYILSLDLQACIKKEHNSHFLFHKNNSRQVVFTSNILNCSLSDIIMEYYLNKEHLNMPGFGVLTQEELASIEADKYCVDYIFTKMENFLFRVCKNKMICDRAVCTRKCCDYGEVFVKDASSSKCMSLPSKPWFHRIQMLNVHTVLKQTLDAEPAAFGVLRKVNCTKFRLDPDSYPEDVHMISAVDGSLIFVNTGKRFSNSQYCVESIYNGTHTSQNLFTFVCFDSKSIEKENIRFKIYPIGILISCCFYAVTLIVYFTLKRLRNLPGKILICLVINLLIAYLGIAFGQLMPSIDDFKCALSGYLVYFFLMAAFAWMNIMSYDIWQTFRIKNGCVSTKRSGKFLKFSMYGWGIPSLLTGIVYGISKIHNEDLKLTSLFGKGRCWFTYNSMDWRNVVLFSGPVGFLLLINFLLFCSTFKYCNQVKREIYRLQSTDASKFFLKKRFFMHKARFAMNTKLFVVMGITWFTELFSILFYDHQNNFFWIISDSFNILLGISVFYIFVFKKRIWILIKQIFDDHSERLRLTPM